MLTIACVNVGNYLGRGQEYVKILRNMVERNLGRPFQFVCITDTPIDGVDCLSPPEELTGWWAKLWMFKALKGDVLYFDLDTVITGPLEFLVDYQGEFATLRDFYRWNGLQSSVVRYSGDHSHIWERWVEAGQPKVAGGDQAWLERVIPEAKRLQDLFPERFCSYKRDASEWIPSLKTSVVCFHGQPRPHEVTDRWVPQVWCMGGLAQPRFIHGLNTLPEVMLAQAEENLKRDLPVFLEMEPHAGKALIVGGGPSLADELPHLRWHQDRGGHIFALNGAYAWLRERGITPEFHVLLDARPENVKFVARPSKKTTYLLAAQCHPSVFDALEDYDVVMWVKAMDGMQALIDSFDKPLCMFGGGNTVGTSAMILVAMWGYRTLHFYGFDSCYRGDDNHAYRQPMNDGEATLDIVCAGKTFHCARWMARQAMDFQKFLPMLQAMGCNIVVHGDGLISWMIENEPGQVDLLTEEEIEQRYAA